MAQLIDLAVRHVRENNLKGRTPIYSAARFVRLVGDVDPTELGTKELNAYRAACLELELSPKTIESSIGNILTIVSEMTGRKIPAGKRLKLKKPVPRPAGDDQITAVYERAPQWLRGWIALTVWTGLRVGDGVELMWEIAGTDPGSVLRTNAGKTGKQHVFPMPDWLRQIVADSPFPREYCLENTKKYVRAQIYLCCESAGIRKWGPKNLRQRAITEWSKANATAGAILHGCGLGVMHHYLDPLSVLESAMHRVRVPACFGAVVSSEDSLLSAYRRLDPAAQGLVSMTAERLAAG